MNINEHFFKRNERKFAEQQRWYTFKIITKSAANYY